MQNPDGKKNWETTQTGGGTRGKEVVGGRLGGDKIEEKRRQNLEETEKVAAAMR